VLARIQGERYQDSDIDPTFLWLPMDGMVRYKRYGGVVHSGMDSLYRLLGICIVDFLLYFKVN